MSQTPTRLVLTRARAMVADESTWLQHDWKDETCDRTKRCTYQAVEDAALELGLGEDKPLELLASAIGDDTDCPRDVIPEFNDNATHQDVMALFDLALENV